MSFFLSPPGLQFDGPSAPTYQARAPFPVSLCTWHPVLGSLPMIPSPRGGCSQILTEPPSRLNIGHESDVGRGKGAYGRHNFSRHRSGWSSGKDFQGHTTALSHHPPRCCCFCCKRVPLPQPRLLRCAASVRVSAPGWMPPPACSPHLTQLQVKASASLSGWWGINHIKNPN